jgi:hypothetical protein
VSRRTSRRRSSSLSQTGLVSSIFAGSVSRLPITPRRTSTPAVIGSAIVEPPAQVAHVPRAHGAVLPLRRAPASTCAGLAVRPRWRRPRGLRCRVSPTPPRGAAPCRRASWAPARRRCAGPARAGRGVDVAELGPGLRHRRAPAPESRRAQGRLARPRGLLAGLAADASAPGAPMSPLQPVGYQGVPGDGSAPLTAHRASRARLELVFATEGTSLGVEGRLLGRRNTLLCHNEYYDTS